MGMKQSKRSVDITTSPKKSAALETASTDSKDKAVSEAPTIEKVEEEQQEKQEKTTVNGDSKPQEQTQLNETTTEDNKEKSQIEANESKVDDKEAAKSPENNKEAAAKEEKKEKVKKKRSFRSFSFLRREKKVKEEAKNGDVAKESPAKAEQSTEQEAAPVAVEETPASEDAQAPAAEAEATTPKTEEAAEESPAAEAEAEAVEAPVQESAPDVAAPAEADAKKTEEPAAQLSTETSSVAATPAASVATPPPPASLTQSSTAEIRTEESLPTPPPTPPPPMIEESTTQVDWDPAFQVIPVKQEAEIAACLVEEVCVITDPETRGRVETTTTPNLIPNVDTLDTPEPETDVLIQMKDKRAEFIKNMVGSLSSADEVPIPSPDSEELGTPPPLPASLPPTADTSMNDSGLEQSLPVPEIDAEISVYVPESELEPVLEVEVQSQIVDPIESAPVIEIEVQVPNADLSASVAADQSISELILAVEDLVIVAEPDSTQDDSLLPPLPSLELDVSVPASEADCLEQEHVEPCPNSDSVLEASLQVQPDSTVLTLSELDDSLMPASTIDEDSEHIAEAEQVEESEAPEAVADEAQPEQSAEEQASQEAQQEESQAEAQESDKAPAAEEESTETKAVEE